MKYDDAEYYFLDFETELPNENGGRHMGLFLEWAVLRGLASDELMTRSEALRRGETTGLELLFDHCDGKLWDSDLNDEGNAFAMDAYERWGMVDFIDAMNCTAESSGDDIFGAEVTPQRHDRVLWQWDRRYSDWLRQFGLPDKDALLGRLLVAVQPVAEAAGFSRLVDNARGSHQVGATFECADTWGYRRFEMTAVDIPQWFYGVRVRLYVHHQQLCDVIYTEKQLDQDLASGLQTCAEVSFASLAEGWDGPRHDYLMRDCGSGFSAMRRSRRSRRGWPGACVRSHCRRCAVLMGSTAWRWRMARGRCRHRRSTSRAIPTRRCCRRRWRGIRAWGRCSWKRKLLSVQPNRIS